MKFLFPFSTLSLASVSHRIFYWVIFFQYKLVNFGEIFNSLLTYVSILYPLTTPQNPQKNTYAILIKPVTLLKKGLWHMCFPVNFVVFSEGCKMEKLDRNG